MHRPPLTVESASIDYGAARALAARVAATGDAGNAAPAADGAENLPPLLNAGTAGAAGALLARVLEAAAELECRCVGRNADDAAAVRNGLVALAAHVGALERRLDKAVSFWVGGANCSGNDDAPDSKFVTVASTHTHTAPAPVRRPGRRPGSRPR